MSEPTEVKATVEATIIKKQLRLPASLNLQLKQISFKLKQTDNVWSENYCIIYAIKYWLAAINRRK